MPRFSLPVRHFALAAAAFWCFAFFLFLGRHRMIGFDLDARWVLGCVHLLTLGFLSATLFGALSQMLPAHAKAPLRLPWAAAAGFWTLCAGLTLFVAELWLGKPYWPGASLAGAAAALYLACYGTTLARAGALPWTEKHFAAALVSLAAVGTLGVLLAIDRQRGVMLAHPDRALIAHIHLAVIGWISLSILGASYRLFYAAAQGRAVDPRGGTAAVALFAAGLAGLTIDALWGGLRLARVWALVMTGGYAAYLWQLKPLAGNRKGLDALDALVFLALAGGVVWAGLGLSLAFGWVEDRWEARAAYCVVALLGWAVPWVLAQSLKIFPVLVWRSAYGERDDAPEFTGASRPLAWVACACLALGWPLAAGGLLAERQDALTLGLAFVLACATLYAAQSGVWISHLIRPRGDRP